MYVTTIERCCLSPAVHHGALESGRTRLETAPWLEPLISLAYVGAKAPIHKTFGLGLAVAELVDPAGKDFVVGGGEVDKFDTHTNTWFNDAHHSESFDDLALVRKSHTRA